MVERRLAPAGRTLAARTPAETRRPEHHLQGVREPLKRALQTWRPSRQVDVGLIYHQRPAQHAKSRYVSTVCVVLPNQACWSPCTSMARPKSASFTAAPFILLASNRFSGWDRDRDTDEDGETGTGTDGQAAEGRNRTEGCRGNGRFASSTRPYMGIGP